MADAREDDASGVFYLGGILREHRVETDCIAGALDATQIAAAVVENGEHGAAWIARSRMTASASADEAAQSLL